MHTLTSLNPVAILVVSVISFMLGGLWYSPLLFMHAWIKEMKMTPEMMKANSKGPLRTFGTALLLTLVSTATLATLIGLCHVASPLRGAEFGLFVAVGIVAAREGTNAVFENRTFRHFSILAGYDVVLFAIQGSILAVWR
jgi:Protein of unknown function (DUF1761)